MTRPREPRHHHPHGPQSHPDTISDTGMSQPDTPRTTDAYKRSWSHNMTTFAEALTRAKNVVDREYGHGHDSRIRAAVEPLINDELARKAVLAAFTDQPAARAASSGWAGIRDDTPPDGIITTSGPEAAHAFMTLKARADLARQILDTFKARKTGGGWNAYANDKTMQEWRDQLSETTVTT